MMMNELEFKKIVSENLQYYRKLKNLTQLELAEAINYSDKSISKWERGESLPDLFILTEIAKLYGITLNDLVSPKKVKPAKKKNKILITLIAVGLVWLVATVAFVFLNILFPDFKKEYLTFIYAIPISMVVLLVFSNIWGNKIHVFIALSILYWSIALSISLSLSHEKIWLIFIIAIPLQIITIFWLLLKYEKK